MLIKKKNGTVLRVSLLFQSPPQSLILLAIPLNPCCVQTTPSKVRAPLEHSLPSTSVSPIFRRLLNKYLFSSPFLFLDYQTLEIIGWIFCHSILHL